MNPSLSPVAIGAVGGSGTRVVARLLQDAGYYIGSDLNDANDNLWFPLLFSRRNILIDPRFDILVEIFYRRMSGGTVMGDNAHELVADLAREGRPQFSREWLAERARTFLDGTDGVAHRAWGWKAPNTHVVVDRLLRFDRELRYIHVMRNGLDMAHSANQNQLRLWGAIFLGREVELTPHDSLAYWCAVHRRMLAIAALFPDRVMIVDFDRLCHSPQSVCEEILAFCLHPAAREVAASFAGKVMTPRSIGRFRAHDTGQFSADDIAFVGRLGFPVD